MSLDESKIALLKRKKAIIQELLARIDARKDTIGLIKYFHPEYIFAKFHQEVSDKLLKLESGEIKNLMLLFPPRHFKTEFVSRYFPARIMGKYDNQQIIAVSHTAGLADDIGREVRNIIDSREFSVLYGGLELRTDSQAANRWHTSRGGIYNAVGMDGGATGKGAHWLIMDDPHKDRSSADSEIERKRVINTYKSTLYTRLMPGARKILAMQRWHENDLSGYLMDEMSNGGEQWEIVKYPAINLKGEALFPAWFNIDALNQIKRSMGSRNWSSQYQQEPIIEGGNIVQQAWFRYWDNNTCPKLFDELIQSWDLKFSSKANEGSFVVGQVWGRVGIDYYLLDQYRKQAGYVETKRAILSMSEKWPWAKRKLVENKANGPALEDDLRNELTGIVLANPDGDKKARLYSVTPCMETGHVYLPTPQTHRWVEHEYIPELIRFTGNKTEVNDQVDTTSQALHYFEEEKSGANKMHSVNIPNRPSINKQTIDPTQMWKIT
jgi:predicted phage terminase large subunit-like protein